ncbi:MAG: hypothetical protein ABI605_10970 [Rhizobacter sp.]
MATAHTIRAADESGSAERLTADERVSRSEEEFRNLALLQQRLRAAGAAPAQQGVCTNCLEQCLPQAVYCDPECRDDHEQRLVLAARSGVGRS